MSKNTFKKLLDTDTTVTSDINATVIDLSSRPNTNKVFVV